MCPSIAGRAGVGRDGIDKDCCLQNDDSDYRVRDHYKRRGIRDLQTPGQKQHDYDNKNDAANSDSARRTVGVITTATAKQQKQD